MSLHGLSMSTACQSEFASRTHCLVESVLSVLAAQVREYGVLNEHARCNGCISTRDRLHAFAFHEHCRRAIVPQDNGSDHRARTMILQGEKTARKPGFAYIALLSGDWCVPDFHVMNARPISTLFSRQRQRRYSRTSCLHYACLLYTSPSPRD